jgi:cytoskeletal protein CcmA (bactofilin family)
MWKRDEAVKSTSGQPASPAQVASTSAASTSAAPQPESRQIARDMVNIGRSVVIKGELNGSEDLIIEGRVEGKIELKDHVLTIGPNGKIKAQVFAKAVIVLGEVDGNVTASEKVDIRDGGSVDGDIIAPRVAIAESAHFRGSVDMQRKRPAVSPGQLMLVEVRVPGDDATAQEAVARIRTGIEEFLGSFGFTVATEGAGFVVRPGSSVMTTVLNASRPASASH